MQGKAYLYVPNNQIDASLQAKVRITSHFSYFWSYQVSDDEVTE